MGGREIRRGALYVGCRLLWRQEASCLAADCSTPDNDIKKKWGFIKSERTLHGGGEREADWGEWMLPSGSVLGWWSVCEVGCGW